MLGLGLGLSAPRSARGLFVDPATTALVQRMDPPPSPGRITAIDTCVAALKTGGVWDKLYALWLLAAHDEQAAYLNWSGTSYTLLKTGGVAFTANQDCVPNGTDGYLDTQLAPVAAAQDSFAFGVWIRTSAQISGNPIALGVGAGASLNPRSTSDTAVFRANNTTNTTIASQTDASGLAMADRSASNLTTFYRNGVSVGTSAAASGTPSSNSLNIGRANTFFVSAPVQAAVVSQSLTAPQHAALHAALAAYLVAVGAA